MEKELASHVVRAAFRSATRLEELLPLLKDHCSEEEGKKYRTAIASAIAHIHRELTDKVFSAHPLLREEIESIVNKYGRIL